MWQDRCSSRALGSSVQATTDAATWRWAISMARLGPETTATRCGGTSSVSMITSLIRFSEPSSMPLISETSSVWGGMSGAQASRQARSVCAGTAKTTRSAPSTASAASSVAVSDAGSGIPGRYLGFSWLVVIAVAISALRAQIVTGVPASASTSANVVPHDPAPSTAAFTARSPPAQPHPAQQRRQA